MKIWASFELFLEFFFFLNILFEKEGSDYIKFQESICTSITISTYQINYYHKVFLKKQAWACKSSEGKTDFQRWVTNFAK